MARQNTRNGNTRRGREERVKEYDALIRYASAIVLLAAGVLLALAVFGAAGPVGAAVFSASYLVVGIGAFLLPIALIAVGFYAGFGRPSIAPLTTSGLLLVAASVLAFAGLLPGARHSLHFSAFGERLYCSSQLSPSALRSRSILKLLSRL